MKLHYLFLGIACLSLPVLADTQTEILSDKLDRLEGEIALLQKKVFQAPVPDTSNTVQESNTKPSNIDEFYAALDMQNQNIQELTAKNEQMAHELSELKAQLNRMNEDINFRFNEIKNSPKEIKEVKQTDPIDSVSETESYNKAYNLLKNGDYEKAEQAFITFMEKYPNGKLIGNANYWLGESYYARQKWAEASGLFADGFTKYKDSSKAPDSMFKLGLTMKKLNKKKEACTAFKGLKNYKDLSKTLKDRSQKEIKEMKCS